MPATLTAPAPTATHTDTPGPRIYLGAAPPEAKPPVAYPTKRAPGAYWDLLSAPHGLIVGGTGGGKSALQRTIAKGALDRGMKLYNGDGKEAGSGSYLKGSIGVEAVEEHPLGIAEMIRWIYFEMRRRYRQLTVLREKAWRTRTRPPAPPDWEELLVMIDEYQSLLAMLPSDLRKRVNSWIVDLGRRTRECKIHLLLAMQDPRSRAVDAGLDPELKKQLALRVAMGEIDGSLAGMAFDNYDLAGLSQGEHIPRGRGIVQVGTVWTPFQAAYFPDPCHWETSDEECERAWRMLPPQDPDWEMWSVRRGLDLPDLQDDEDDELEPLTAAAGAAASTAQAAGLRSLA